MWFYRFVRFIAFPFQWAALTLNAKENKSLYHERLGTSTEDRPKGDLVWLHCRRVSDAGPIAREIAAAMPNKTILITFVEDDTDGRAHFYSNILVQRAPMDTYCAARNFLRFWEPSIAMRSGSELYPNILARLRKMEIPSFLMNAELSDRSYRRWKLLRRFARKIVRNLSFIWATDNLQTLRFANLGARDIMSQELIGANKPREIIAQIRQMTR